MTPEKKPENVIGSESAMLLALRDHYSAPEHVLLPQVRSTVGFAACRTADAMAMSVWPSRGLHLYGIEIKVSRGDWMRELKNPRKADEIGKFCDYWVIAAGSETIVKDGEMPTGWGLLVPGKKIGSPLRMKVPPVRIEHVEPISRQFLASILRKTFECHIPAAEVDAEINRRVNASVAKLEESITARISRELDRDKLLKQNAEMTAAMQSFKEASGVDMYSILHDAKVYGRALKLLRWSGIDGLFKTAIDVAKVHLKSLEDISAELPQSGDGIETW